MERLPEYIHENGIDYLLVGDYYIPMLVLPEEERLMGHWGGCAGIILRECHPGYYCSLLLSGRLWTYLADLDEQAQGQLDTIIGQMMSAEGVTEKLKESDQPEWVWCMNSIHSRADLIYA